MKNNNEKLELTTEGTNMGFEVKYSYFKEVSRGRYNEEEAFSDSIFVGDGAEEVPVENLAAKIMSLLARRNIFVHDIEIYEIVKNKISFKEYQDGIQIKNRKFSFDDSEKIVSGLSASSSETKEVASQTTMQKDDIPMERIISEVVKRMATEGTQNLRPNNVNLAGPARPRNQENVNLEKIDIDQSTPVDVLLRARPLRKEFYVSVGFEDIEKTKPYKLTDGREYAIYLEVKEGIDPLTGGPAKSYLVIDDRGKKALVSDVLFSASRSDLDTTKMAGAHQGVPSIRGGSSSRNPTGNLHVPGLVKESQVELRR